MFTNNTQRHRFEYTFNDQLVFADYRQDEKTLYIDYVEAPPVLRGTGAAGKLMQSVMDFAKQNTLEVVPICGYAASWMSRNGYEH